MKCIVKSPLTLDAKSYSVGDEVELHPATATRLQSRGVVVPVAAQELSETSVPDKALEKALADNKTLSDGLNDLKERLDSEVKKTETQSGQIEELLKQRDELLKKNADMASDIERLEKKVSGLENPAEPKPKGKK